MIRAQKVQNNTDCMADLLSRNVIANDLIDKYMQLGEYKKTNPIHSSLDPLECHRIQKPLKPIMLHLGWEAELTSVI